MKRSGGSIDWSGASSTAARRAASSTRCALLAQRIFALALGYEDLNDHDTLRSDPVFGVLVVKLEEPLAGKSTLKRLELFAPQGLSRYHRIRPDGEAIERLFVELFLDSYRTPPAEIVLDLDATGVPLHGDQERRFRYRPEPSVRALAPQNQGRSPDPHTRSLAYRHDLRNGGAAIQHRDAFATLDGAQELAEFRLEFGNTHLLHDDT